MLNDDKVKEVHIKHLNTFDAAGMDMVRETYFNEAKSKKLPTEKEQLEYLSENEIWTTSDETELINLERYLVNLRVSRSKLFIRQEREQITNQIAQTEEDIKRKQMERMDHLGITSDSFASKKANEYYIFCSVFKDNEFKEKKFTEAEFDDLSSTDVAEIVESYNSKMRKFHSKNLKRIALSGFFLNFYHLCDDNPLTFFGKAATQLTFYQAELFGHGRYFKHILQNSKNRPPDDIMDDPDKIIEWYEASTSAQAAMEKASTSADKMGGSSIVGASRKDMEELGTASEDTEAINLAAEAAKKGGQLSMADLLKLHGA